MTEEEKEKLKELDIVMRVTTHLKTILKGKINLNRNAIYTIDVYQNKFIEIYERDFPNVVNEFKKVLAIQTPSPADDEITEDKETNKIRAGNKQKHVLKVIEKDRDKQSE